MNALRFIAAFSKGNSVGAALAVTFMLIGCASRLPAPVSDRSAATVMVEGAAPAVPPATAPAVAGYIVKKGDTLYSIALDQGHDYRDLAAWNNLENPNVIKVGQSLRMTPPDGSAGASTASPVATTRPVSAPARIEVKPIGGAPAANAPVIGGNTDALKREPKGGKVAYSEAALARMKEADSQYPVKAAEPITQSAEPKSAEQSATATEAGVDWAWPVGGKVQTGFVEGSTKGIDIPGALGDPVVAAGPGKVVYAGSGLRGYGKLVIVRHNANYLSAYAHNSQILVKEGQVVTGGQKIAEVGSTDTDSPRLHFEIRRQGKPVDPQKYLPVR